MPRAAKSLMISVNMFSPNAQLARGLAELYGESVGGLVAAEFSAVAAGDVVAGNVVVVAPHDELEELLDADELAIGNFPHPRASTTSICYLFVSIVIRVAT